MATQGFDPTFGLAGTVISEASGFGGWPLAVTTGPDGRLTMLCSSFDQPLAQRGSRLTKKPVRTVRVVSVPTPVTGIGNSKPAVFGPDAFEFLPSVAIAKSDQLAVLGTIVQANRAVAMLIVFDAGPTAMGATQWSAGRQVLLPGLAGIGTDRCGLGWDPTGGVIAVGAALRTAGRPAFTLTAIRDSAPTRPTRINIPMPATLNLPPGFTIRPRIGTVLADLSGQATVAISWEGLDPARGRFRPIGTIDEARASVLRLRPNQGGGRATLEPDPNFGVDGFWLATAAQGEVTTADFLASQPNQPLVVVGRARQPATSLLAVGLDFDTGAEQWVSYPAAGVLSRPTAAEYDAQGRIVIVGGTVDYDQNAPSDPSEGVVACLTSAGDPDPTYPAGGLSRFRLHGGTHPAAVHFPAAGGVMVASAVPWGWQASAPSFHPCLTRLTDAGARDLSFGTAGLASHDGIGDSFICLVGPTGQVWSAGKVPVLTGVLPPVAPGQPERLDLLWTLTAARLTVDGAIDPTFGATGIASIQLAGMLPPGKQFFDVESLVPLANGQAWCSGWFGELVPVGFGGGGGFQFDPQGTWLLRLTSSGGIDPTFGGGVRTFLNRRFGFRTELTDGSVQGFEVTNGLEMIRWAADGTPAAGWGTTGTKPIPRIPSSFPTGFFPDGSWYGPVSGPFVGTSETFGLIRYRPDGTLDPAFGAADPMNLTGRLINIATSGKYGAMLTDHRAQVAQLADGSFLLIWSVTWQEDVTVFPSMNTIAFRPVGMLLAAFEPDGLPRAIPGWNGQSVRAIPNPVSQTTPLGSWLGWRQTAALLQADGSIIVSLQGDDLLAKPSANMGPRPIRQTNYFCRLVPPNFDLDQNFGTGQGLARGFAVARLHQEAEQVATTLAPGNGGQVIAAIAIISSDIIGGAARSPDLPLDGSIGVARLV